MNNIRILQSSPGHTGSTLLLNLIHGFCLPDDPIYCDEPPNLNDFFIIKTHNTNIDYWENNYKNYKLYFIMSERYDNKVQSIINDKYRNKENILIINFNEINESNINTIDNIINNIFNKFINFLPNEIIPKKNYELIKQDMKNRVIFMNKITEEIKDKSFEYWDKFTGIHGSHRNRNF